MSCPHTNTERGQFYEACLDCGAVRRRDAGAWHSCHLCRYPAAAAGPRFVVVQNANDGTRFFWDHAARAWTTDQAEATEFSPEERRLGRNLRGGPLTGAWVCASCLQGDPTREYHTCRS